MNNFNPMNYNYNQKIMSSYVFKDNRDMNRFLKEAKYSNGILNMNQTTKNGIAVEFRDASTKEEFDGVWAVNVEEVYSRERMAAKTKKVRDNAAKNLRAIAKRKKEEKEGKRPPRKPNNVGERGGSYGPQSGTAGPQGNANTGRGRGG